VPEVLCVADAAGYPIALRRLDNGKVSSVQIALNKAFTAAAHRKPTHQYKNALPGEEAFGIFTQHEGRFTVFVGGMPVIIGGKVVGGISASGGNGEQDIACCEAGIAALVAHLGG
ncbi:MAG: GlcG/HbpS family heme-binding protein, partial [Acetobacteraceae bacterium]